jgi:aspergillopepsin I
MMTADGFAIGNKQSNTPQQGIADTGTTLLMLDSSVVTAYYKQVKGAKNDPQQGGYTFPCSATLPDFSLIIEGEIRTGTWPISYQREVMLIKTSSWKLCQLRAGG